jgi:hypothetical protein
MTLEEIVENLKPLGIAHDVRHSGAEGAILLLPEYGRVLGVWPHWRGENSLWVNPDFFHTLRFGAKDDGWRNPGGDRIWLAPADEFFGEGGAVAPSIDPGAYSLSWDRGAACMASRGEAWARRSAARVRFRITRRIDTQDEAGLDQVWGQTWLRRAGFEEEIQLEIEGKCPVAVQLWNLVQVPPGSQVLKAETSPRGGRRMLCLQDLESGRARLLVMSYAAAGEDALTPSPVHGRYADVTPGELSCSSPSFVPGGKRSLLWKKSTCAFSGRSGDIQQLAARMIYSIHTKE